MGTRRESGITNRRGFLVNGMSLAGAAALTSAAAEPFRRRSIGRPGPARPGGCARERRAGGIRPHRQIGRAPRRQRDELRLCRQGGTVDLPQRPRGLRFRARACARGGRSARQSPERPSAAAAGGRLHPAADAFDPEGVRQRPAERGAGRPVLHHGAGGVGLSPRALCRVRQLHPAQHVDHHGAVLHGAHQYPHLDDRHRAGTGLDGREVHLAGPGDLGLRLQSRGRRQ